MRIEHALECGDANMVLPRIESLLVWARGANEYIDDHNEPAPGAGDRGTRDALAAAMEELGDLMQRYADSLRRFGDREPPPECGATPTRDASDARWGTLLTFPSRGDVARTHA